MSNFIWDRVYHINSVNISIYLLWTSVQNVHFYTGRRLGHYENMPIKIYWKFYHQKMKIFG